MVLFRHGPVGPFDGAIIGIGGNAQDFVVVLCLAALEQGVGLLEERLHILGSRMVFFCKIEGANGGFEVFGVKLTLCMSQ